MPHTQPDLTATLGRINEVSAQLESFWSAAHGWAPPEAAALLSRSRLDWLSSFNRMLASRVAEVRAHGSEPASLILAWAHLRALVEGHLKLFLAVYLRDYLADPDAAKDKNGALLSPDKLQLEVIRQFLAKRSLLSSQVAFVSLVQSRGNAIHAFKTRDIGTAAEFLLAIPAYHAFLTAIDEALPYP